MLKVIVYSCKLHIFDMFYEIHVMVSRGPVKSLFKKFHLYHFFVVIFHS